MNRLSLSCVLWCAATVASAQTKVLVVAQIAPLTGAAASIGVPVTQAAHAVFKRINASGGINGYRIELIDRDDHFDPAATLSEARRVLTERPVIALLNIVGAPNNGGLVTSGLLERNNLAVVGAFTGATSVRALASPNMYFVRASVADEARRIVEQLATLGLTRIGLLHADDAFGLDARQHVEKALRDRSLALAVARVYQPAGTSVGDAAQSFLHNKVQAVIMFATGPASARFAAQYRAAGGRGMLLANSSTSPDSLIRLAGPEVAQGIGLAQVMPPLRKTTTRFVKDYIETLQKYGDPQWQPSAYGLEGYLAAHLLAEGIRRSGPSPSRPSLLKALASLGRVDFGGFPLDYSDGRREGSHFVEIGIVGPGGRLLN